jgi:diguanylate cyclase (GGDEF)-like protein
VVIDHYAGAGAAVRFAISLSLVIGIVTVMLNTRRDLQRTLAAQAMTDPLTGAFNRRQLESCLSGAIERRNRTGEAASLALFDVDHFKQINDELGHTAGDAVLKQLVTLVAGRARKLDVLFRIGGEEFLLLLPGARYAGAVAVAEDLRVLVASAALVEGRRVSISVGVSELDADRTAADWIDEADAALAEAKRGGRNRVAGRTPVATRMVLAR